MGKIRKIEKRAGVLGIAVMLTFSLTACANLINRLDVIGEGARTSFAEVLNAMPEGISADEESNGWVLASPDGAARFGWSGDWSKSSRYDIMLEVDAQPFLDAGMNPDQLPETIIVQDDKLIIGEKLDSNSTQYNGTGEAADAFNQIVGQARDIIGYHTDMDHFGVDLGHGNKFEWAKDMSTNENDIVFVLNPEPFIDAGADPGAIEGWSFGTVSMSMHGKVMETEKLLKPFNIK